MTGLLQPTKNLLPFGIIYLLLLLSGKSFTGQKNKAETLLQDFSLFYYFACCKINTSNMSKSTYSTGQPVYSQVIKWYRPKNLHTFSDNTLISP